MADEQRETMTDVVADLKIELVNGGFIPAREGWPAGSTHYRLTLKRTEGTGEDAVDVLYEDGPVYDAFPIEYSQGSAHKGDPNVADVVACLASDASGADQPFEAWCGDYGYDTDSRKAYATWEACKQTLTLLQHFLGAHFDRVMNAEH